MAQEIKIPIEAKTAGAVKAADELADAFSEVGAAVGTIDTSSRRAAEGLDRMLDRLEEVKRAQESLKRIGFNVSESDASAFLERWDSMRRARGPATARVRQFDTFQDWFHGHEGLYGSPREAARHRRAMVETALQGTEYRRTSGPAVDDGGSGGGGNQGGGGSGGAGDTWGRGLNRAHSSAMSFGRSMLALAGVNSVMGMAGRALDNSTEESTGVDTLKRRMGDLGVDFDFLRTQARAAGQGLGVTSVETVRLEQAYARTVGNLNFRSSVAGSVRVGEGLSRAYGLDLEEGNQFFGSMAKNGVARDEQSQRRLALLIGDSVARSGYSGKVDELLGAITNYSAIAARQTLTTPNVEAYANALTSLAGKYAGMGPSEAGAMIGQADSSVRRGGAMGEASQNFIYSALRNFSPGISPLQGMAMWQGGLFSTNANTFGQGPLKGLGPSKGNMTTFEKIVRTLRGRGAYKDPLYLASAMSGITGLDLAQSKALTDMAVSGQLGQSMGLLQSAGMDPNTVSATGMPLIGSIANAKGRGGLSTIYQQMMGRSDLSGTQRAALEHAMKSGGDDELRKAMVRVAANLDQEATKGTETRNSISNLNNTLTKVGGDLLGPINTIRDGIVALAGQQVPGFTEVSSGARNVGASPYAASAASKSVAASGLMKAAMGLGMTRLGAAGLLGNAWAESKFDPKAVGDNGKAFGMFQMHADRWNPYVKWAKSKGLDPWTQIPQLQYAIQQEMMNSESSARAKLRFASSTEEATAAGLRFERPKGYSERRPQDSMAYSDRLAATQSLYASVDVNLKHPDGTTQKVTVPLKPVAAPKPAGTVSYSADQDYR